MRSEVSEAVKAAMRAGNKPRLSALRMISAKIKDVDLAAQGKREATEAELVEALAKMVKQRRDSIVQFKSGNRDDLVAQELGEIAVIEEFLPKGLTNDEVMAAIDASIKETGATSQKEMGKVMALLKDRFAGRMDFSAAGAAVKAKLGGK